MNCETNGANFSKNSLRAQRSGQSGSMLAADFAEDVAVTMAGTMGFPQKDFDFAFPKVSSSTAKSMLERFIASHAVGLSAPDLSMLLKVRGALEIAANEEAWSS